MQHRVVLADDWSVWRWCCLRGAGFPARLLLALTAPHVTAAEDAWRARQAAADALRDDLVARCQAVLEAQGADVARWARHAVRRLRRGAVPEEALPDPALEAMRGAYAEASVEVARTRAAVAAAFEIDRRETSEILRQHASDPRFRRAVLWQNRQVVTTGALEVLRRTPATATDTKTRQHERLVASYLQRYCAKNDTIGFFGPVGWARFEDGDAPIVQRPGQGVETDARVYFEYWAIDAVAAALAADERWKPYLPPRLLPQFRIEGTTLCHGDRRDELPEEFARVAAACDGERLPGEIADALALDRDEVLGLLEELAGSKVIAWTLEIPTATARPEAWLRRAIDFVDDDALRTEHGAVLDRLVARRDAIARATTDADLAAALVALEETFTEITGAEGRREGGKAYAGRMLVYEDCRRDTEVAFGASFRARLAAPLALILASARWYTYEIARRYRAALFEIYDRLRPAPGGAVDYARFWREAIALFPGPSAGIVAAVRAELHAKWRAILGLEGAGAGAGDGDGDGDGDGEGDGDGDGDGEGRVVHRRAAAIAEAVAREFAAPGPGWPVARYQSPDVLVCADGTFVLGELHAGFNTIGPLFVKEHPDPDALVRAREADIEHVGIAPVWSKAITRGDYYSLSPRDLDLESAATKSARPRTHVVATSALEIVEDAGLLVARTRDGARRFEIVELFEHHLIAESFGAFSLLASQARSPRIVLDDVVIARETWRPALPGWPAIEDAVERHLAARAWARELGLPRWVFVKTPEETKPTYVDFESPIFVDMLGRSLRAASAVTVSEMLPGLADAWLVDGAGERYTSELRIVCVDARPWRPEGRQVR